MKPYFLKLVQLLLCLFIGSRAYAAFNINGIYYIKSQENAIVFSVPYGAPLYAGEIEIPESVVIQDKTYTVTGIDYQAFSGCVDLTKITFPNSLTEIGMEAFVGCTGLKEVNFGTGLKYLGIEAFRGCTSLETIDIPNSVTRIREMAFEECSGLKSVTMGSGLTSIDASTFYGCSSLTEVHFGPNVQYIGDGAFRGCTSLKSIDLPDAILDLGKGSFRGCSSLESITIPEGVTSINEAVFRYCTSMTQVYIPSTVTQIDIEAFYNCTQLQEIFCFAKEPPTLQWSTFPYSDLNASGVAVYVPDGTIEKYKADSYWGRFWKVKEMVISFVDPVVKAICLEHWDANRDGELSFTEAAAVKDIGMAFRGNTYITSFAELKYFTGLTEIKEEAFWACINLYNITIPKNVQYIGCAFQNCRSLGIIKVDKENPYYHSHNDCNAIIEVATQTLIAGCPTTKIPDDVKIIGRSAFEGRLGLYDLVIPYGVTTIELSAFNDCQALISVQIPNSLTTIAASAFYACPNLTSLTIPSSVATIGRNAFAFCTGLTSIKVVGNPLFNSDNDCNAIIETNTGTLIVGCRTTVIPYGVTYIGESAFEGHGYMQNEGLTSINIPATVVGIGRHAFASCQKLKLIRCDALTPPDADTQTFNFGVNGVNPQDITLVVPDESYQLYKKHSIWGEFHLVMRDAIQAPFEDATGAAKVCECYDLNGRRITAPQRGINILRMHDGSTRKIVNK